MRPENIRYRMILIECISPVDRALASSQYGDDRGNFGEAICDWMAMRLTGPRTARVAG